MSFFKSKLWPFRKANVLEFEQVAAEPDAPEPNTTLVYLRTGSLRQKTQSGESTLGSGSGEPGEDGREIELQKSSTHIQWRYVSDPTWTNLAALTDITGPAGTNGTDGDDGREVELQKTATHIQWRYGGGVWTNLIALADITGPAGAAGALNLIRASATIHGHTDPGSPPTSAHIVVTFFGASQGTLHLVSGSVDRTYTFAYGDPADGTVFIDLTSLPDGPSVVAQLATQLGDNLTSTTDGNAIHLYTVETGTSATLAGEHGGDLNVSIDPASDNGENEVPPSGALDEVQLIAAVTGKRIKVIAAGFSGSLVQAVALSNTVSGDATGGVLGNGNGILSPTGDTIDSYFNGGVGGALKLRMTGAAPVGGTCFGWVIAVQE
ncbi:MAG: hypothetical protein ABMA13_18985 [Chthoniobacteraceae bacterium]